MDITGTGGMATGTHDFQLSKEEEAFAFRALGTYAALEASEGNPRPLIEAQWPGLLLDDFQHDLLAAIFSPEIREVFVKGNTSCGKGGAVGIAVCLYYSLFEDAKVVITSASYHHAQSVLFAEVRKWFDRMAYPPAGTALRTGISHTAQHYVDVVNPDSDEAFSGRHGRNTLFVFDEATAIADERYKLANTQATTFVAVANPRTLGGAFREAFPLAAPDETATIDGPFGKRRCITVGGGDCMNVRERRLERPLGPLGGIEVRGQHFGHGEPIPEELHAEVAPLIPGQVCYDTWKALVSDPDPFIVEVFGHGRFPTEDPENQLILPSWLPENTAAWHTDLPVSGFGLDVAASRSGDESVLAAGGQEGVRALHVWHYLDTMATVGKVQQIARERYGIDLQQGEVPVAVDMDGLGKGVGDRLAELGVKVVEIRGNAPASEDPHRYGNLRAQAYGMLADRLRPDGKFDQPFGLPDDPKLREELVAPERVFVGSDGLKFRITPKERRPGKVLKGQTLREKLGRSPDRADAVAYMLIGCERKRATLGEWVEAGSF